MSDMNVQRVKDLIAAYGADTGIFPEDEREAAQALMKASPEIFADVLNEAKELDAVLREVPDVVPSKDLFARLIADAPKPQPKRISLSARLRNLLLPSENRWPLAAGLASLAVGALVGVNLSGLETGTYDAAEGEAIYAALGLNEYTYEGEVFQ